MQGIKDSASRKPGDAKPPAPQASGGEPPPDRGPKKKG
jgi:hypothetical protein